jgi:hypothetical protein
VRKYARKKWEKREKLWYENNRGFKDKYHGTYCHVFGGAWLIDGFWIGWLDLLTSYTHHSGLQAITALSLFYTFYSSPLHPRVLSLHESYPGNGFVTVYHFKWHMKSSFHSLISFLSSILNYIRRAQLSTNCSRGTRLDWHLVAWDPRYIASGRTPQKTSIPLLLHFDSLLQRCVYRTVA